MIARALWTCALLALAAGRIYESCELARDLLRLGVSAHHVPTWVCIAYHESLLDTSANNPYSGDHGILQISELYWCGPGSGKACGKPCSAFRDDDITDDVQCALRIYEEHTRLQGNGFLAWVVYPQHCKHNTKKYLANCNQSIWKTVPIVGTAEKARSLYYDTKVDGPEFPSYLTITKLLRSNYNDDDFNATDFINYKIDNIDELKLPQFTRPSTIGPPRTGSSLPTTSAPYAPRIKAWRVIESNQFRHKTTTTTTNPPEPSTVRPTSQATRTTSPRPLLTSRTSAAPTARSTTHFEQNPVLTRRGGFSFGTKIDKAENNENENENAAVTTKPKITSIDFSPTYPSTTETIKSSYLLTLKTITSTQRPEPQRYVQPWKFNSSNNFRFSSTTVQPYKLGTNRPAIKPYLTTTPQVQRSTQSIFDLYLHPTKRPKPWYSFEPIRSANRFRIKIFSDGTTTASPNSKS